jgi:hypothetical protein
VMGKLVKMILVLVVGGAYFVLLHLYSPARHTGFSREFPEGRPEGPTEVIDGIEWTEALNWNFKDGDYPTKWSWGEWEIVDGYLHGRDPEGNFAVYFFPYTHGGDVLLETKVQFLEPGKARKTEAHLLTRDSQDLNYESGMVLVADTNIVDLRHMAGKRNYIYDIFPVEQRTGYGDWWVIRFAIYHNRVRGYLNGERIDADLPGLPERLPVGMYQEPHLAVNSGEARFEYVKIYFAADSGKP